MGVNEYSNNVYKNTKESRLGCSVCPKKNIDVKLLDNYSYNQSWHNRKCLKSYINNTKLKKSELTPTPQSKPPIIKECYCNHMRNVKKEVIPTLICSKHFKIPNVIDIDKDWLHDIAEFRRENWFDCHSNLFFDTDYVQNINPLCQ